MTYRDQLTASMTALAQDPKRRFIGYGVRYGRAMGTFKDIPEAQLVETPVAENLMVGLATGMSLAGYKPVVFFERFDFAANAVDAIVNHLAKIKELSRGQFRPAAIMRCVIGNKAKPLFTGPTHTQDFTDAFRAFHCQTLEVLRCHDAEEIEEYYIEADMRQRHGLSTMVVEWKDLL